MSEHYLVFWHDFETAGDQTAVEEDMNRMWRAGYRVKHTQVYALPGVPGGCPPSVRIFILFAKRIEGAGVDSFPVGQAQDQSEPKGVEP